MEAGTIQLHGQGVLEIDPAAYRFRCLTVRQTERELQHTDGGQLQARCRGIRHTGTSPRSPRHTTARPAGLLPTSSSYRPDYPPARPAESGMGPAHRNEDGQTTDTATTASAFETAPSMPTDHAGAPGNTKISDRVKLTPRAPPIPRGSPGPTGSLEPLGFADPTGRGSRPRPMGLRRPWRTGSSADATAEAAPRALPLELSRTRGPRPRAGSFGMPGPRRRRPDMPKEPARSGRRRRG